MLDNFVEQDAVEQRVLEGQILGRAGDETVDPVARALDHAVDVQVDPVGLVGEVREATDVGAEAAAEVQHARTLEWHEAADHLETPFLAEAPDVAGIAEN